MSEPRSSDTSADGHEEPRAGMPLWTKALLVVAVVSALAGLGMELSGSGEQAAGLGPGPGGGPTPLAGISPLAEGTGGGIAAPWSAGGASSWSPYLIRCGFGFLAAFVVGMVLRKSLRIGIFLLGAVGIGAVVLHMTGIVDLDWLAIRSEAGDLVGRLGDEAEGIFDFVKRSLPTSTAATIGLAVGFWRS